MIDAFESVLPLIYLDVFPIHLPPRELWKLVMKLEEEHLNDTENIHPFNPKKPLKGGFLRMTPQGCFTQACLRSLGGWFTICVFDHFLYDLRHGNYSVEKNR